MAPAARSVDRRVETKAGVEPGVELLLHPPGEIAGRRKPAFSPPRRDAEPRGGAARAGTTAALQQSTHVTAGRDSAASFLGHALGGVESVPRSASVSGGWPDHRWPGAGGGAVSVRSPDPGSAAEGMGRPPPG